MAVALNRDAFRFAWIQILCVCFAPMTLASLPMLKAQGTRVVNAQGQPVNLRGCNLGNWLLIEAWMLKWDISDQATIDRTLSDRFGPSESKRLMELYRESYITPRDFQIVKSFNFNCVRVPFNCNLMIDEEGQILPDAFKWLDRALAMAEEAGVYVILDMHGAPGRQSIDHCTGERGKNLLWTQEKYQIQMADLWKRLAERYKDRSVIAAYDLLNEPFGDFKSDMREPLRKLMPKIYQAVRSSGDQHIVLFPQALGRGISFYGDPHSAGMTNVGFTDHLYAGLFGSPATVASHAGVFARTIPDLASYLEKAQGPMLVGEFNVVLHKAGGKPMMRRYYDEFASRGWMATMWSYKILKPSAGVEEDNWYMATNAQTIQPVDVRTSSLQEIESFFKSLGTMPLAVDEKLRKALTDPTAPPMPLPRVAKLPESAPTTRALDKWELTDIDASPAAGIQVNGKTLSLFASGSDIFGTGDSFAYLHQPCGRTATITTRISNLVESDTWTKAGVMLRYGDPSEPNYANAPFVMVHAFPNGLIAFTARSEAGQTATETKRVIGPLPRRLMLVKSGAQVKGYVDTGDDQWVLVGEIDIHSKFTPHMGVAVCSHRDRALTRADFVDLELTASGKFPEAVKHANPSINTESAELLVNPSFESRSGLAAANWNHWGEQLAVTGTGTHSGTAAVEFVAKENAGDSGLWQDVKVEVGATYQLSVFAHRQNDQAKDQNITIALEAEVNGAQVALAERSVDLSELESTGGWSLIHLQCVAPSSTLRVLVRGAPKTCGVVIDDLSLTQLQSSKD